jgi:hypothetical protein
MGNRVSRAAVEAAKPSGLRGAQFWELSVQEVTGCRCGAYKSGKRVQVGGGGGEGRGSLRCRGNECGCACCRRVVAETKAPLAQWELELEAVAIRFNPVVRGSGRPKSLMTAWRRSAARCWRVGMAASNGTVQERCTSRSCMQQERIAHLSWQVRE